MTLVAAASLSRRFRPRQSIARVAQGAPPPPRTRLSRDTCLSLSRHPASRQNKPDRARSSLQYLQRGTKLSIQGHYPYLEGHTRGGSLVRRTPTGEQTELHLVLLGLSAGAGASACALCAAGTRLQGLPPDRIRWCCRPYGLAWHLFL